MIPRLFEHTSAGWAKYSDYEWRMAADGQEYLMPAAKAEADVYNPMTQADELIVEAVNIGLLQFHKTPDVKVKEAIRQFACRYGLLGLMAAIPTTPKFVDYEKVYLPKNPYIRQEVMETTDYLKLFFPFTMPSFYKQGVKSVWQVSGDDKMEIALVSTFFNDPQAKAMSFLRSYGERFDWMKEVFRDWAFAFVSVFLYERDKKKLDSTTRRLYRQGIACFDGNVPSYHLELREHPVMVWDFHSLMLTIRFLLSLSLTDTQNPLKMCEHCQKAFIAKQDSDEYCSEACRKAIKRNK